MFNGPIKSNCYAPKHKRACLTLLDKLCFWPLKLSLKIRKNCELLQTLLWNLMFNDPLISNFYYAPKHKSALKLSLKFRKNCKLLQTPLWNLILRSLDPSKKFYICPPPPTWKYLLNSTWHPLFLAFKIGLKIQEKLQFAASPPLAYQIEFLSHFLTQKCLLNMAWQPWLSLAFKIGLKIH